MPLKKCQTTHFKGLKPLGLHSVVHYHDGHQNHLENFGKILILRAHPRPITREPLEAEPMGPVMMTAMSAYGQGGVLSLSQSQAVQPLRVGTSLHFVP